MNNACPFAKRAFAGWCFSNYLTSCNSLVQQFRLEVIKKTREGGLIHRLYFLILGQQQGLIWYCSQSWEQIFSLIKNQYLLFFFLLYAFNSLAFSSSAATFLCSSPLCHRLLSDDRTEEQSPCASIEPLCRRCNQCSTDPPLELTLAISSLSNGLRPELSGDLQGPSALPFFSASSHLSLPLLLSVSLDGQLKSSDSGDRVPAGANDWTGLSLLLAPGVSRRLVRLLWSPPTSRVQ